MIGRAKRWQGGCSQPQVGAVACLAIAIFVSGCILPQNDHLLTALPVSKNRPPAILETTVSPSGRLIQTSSGPNCRLEFKVPGVIDPDVEDTITLQWFIDYSPNGPPANPYGFTGTYVNKGTALRDPPPEPTSSLVIELYRSDNPLNPLGPHTVEALVSDGVVINHDPQKRHVLLPDGGFADDETYAVSYAWFVNNTDDRTPCPP